MEIRACDSNCTGTVEKIIEESMGWYHSYYASSCLEYGVCRALVARDNGRDIGITVYYTVPTQPIRLVVIYYVAVAPEYRGLGIGKALVLSVEHLNSGSGFIATTQSNNTVSRRLFKNLGYQEYFFDELDWDTALFIEKLTCAYEDDIVFYKDTVSLDEIASVESNRELAEELWDKICYEPWLRLRRRIL
ncbi:MAG: GNAT family N-acetyltransferase [Thermoprotei archaeon]